MVVCLLWVLCVVRCGRGNVFGIATGYGLEGQWIESRSGEIFCTCPDRTWGPPSLLYNAYRVFPAGKERPGCDAAPSPPSSDVVKKSRAIPLIPLWAVRSVQSLSACIRAHFTFLPLCCQVDVSVSGSSLVPRSPTDCGVCECDRESSVMRRPWPNGGLLHHGKIT